MKEQSDYNYNFVPGAIRTHDLLLRRQSLYPAELRGQRQPAMIGYFSLKNNVLYEAYE